MAITTEAQLAAAETAANCQRVQLAKTGATVVAGEQCSYWRMGSAPAAGAVPTTAATCNNTTLGGINFVNPPTGSTLYLSRLQLLASVPGSVEVHDRLAHMGGLVGNSIATQTVNLDLSVLTGDNMAARTGGDYSKVQWFLEWYTATGANAGTVTVNYTNQSGTAKSTTVAVIGNPPTGLLMPIVPLAGDSIRGVVSVMFGTALLTAGNFGVTATVGKCEIGLVEANKLITSAWSDLCLPPIPNSACLTLLADAQSATMPTIGGLINLVQG